MELKDIAKKFASWLQNYMHPLNIEGIILYGSITEGKHCPNDIDILILHNNPVFDKIQAKRGNDNLSSDIERYNLIIAKLQDAGYRCNLDLLSVPGLKESLESEVLSVVFLNSKYMTDKAYKEEMRKSNKNPNFYDTVFRQAHIWNTHLQEFIPLMD